MATTVRDQTQRAHKRPNGGSNRTSGGVRLEEKREPQQVKGRHVITEYIDVGVPADTAFDQWMQFDQWSQMFKKESAKKRGGKSNPTSRGGKGTKLEVTAKIGPSERRWTAEVVGVERGHRVNWRSKGPAQAIGTTSFHRLDDRLTHVMVEMEYRPSGVLETIGNLLRMQRRRVRRDLRLFKNYVELRGVDEGASKGQQGDRREDS